MKKKSVIPIILLLFLLTVSFAQANNVRSRIFTSYFSSGSSIGFQNPPSYVLISITSGNLNSSNSQCALYEGGGYYRFTSNESVTIEITYTVTTVKLAGDDNNDLRAIVNGSSYSISQNDNIQIIWDLTIEPYLPVMFIFGMVGLVSIFGGSLLGVSLLKQGEYKDGVKFCAIWVSLGIALTIAWLFT